MPPRARHPRASCGSRAGRQMKALQGGDESPMQGADVESGDFLQPARHAENIAGQVHDIGEVHPARVLLLVGDGGDRCGRRGASAVDVQWKPVQSTSFAEQVTFAPRRGDRQAAVRRAGCSIGDLPINLWWSSPSRRRLRARCLRIGR